MNDTNIQGDANRRRNNNRLAKQDKNRLVREWTKTAKAADELALMRDSDAGSSKATHQKKLEESLAKKQARLARQIKLLQCYLQSKSNAQRKAIKKRLDQLRNADRSTRGFQRVAVGETVSTAGTVVGQVTRCEFLHGSESTLLQGEGKQFVNLPPDEKWVGGQFADNLDRLGPQVRLRVEFDRPGCHKFKWRLTTDNPADASGTNNNMPTPTLTKPNGKAIIDNVILPEGGQGPFVVVVEDSHGNQKRTTGTLTIDRRQA